MLDSVGETADNPVQEFVMIIKNKSEDGNEIILTLCFVQREVGTKIEREVGTKRKEVFLDKEEINKELEVLGLYPEIIKLALAKENDELSNTYIKNFVSKIKGEIGSKLKKAGQKMGR